MPIVLLRRQDSDFPEIILQPRIYLKNKAICQKSHHKNDSWFKAILTSLYISTAVDKIQSLCAPGTE